MTSQQSGIIMVGAFPPPIHGMAAVNAAIRERLRMAGAAPLVIDLAAPSLGRSLMIRLRRLPKVLRGLARFARWRGLRGKTLYMSVSGGPGQIYELAFLALARLRRMRVFLHHHSFAYLDTPSRVSRALTRFAGPSAVHVVQSPRMAERLQAVYGPARILPVSNTAFLLPNEIGQEKPRKQLRTLGFMSNIVAEKGIFEFLDLMAAVLTRSLLVQAKLAGPFQNSQTERAVHARLEQLHNVEYVGPKYGADKDDFFAGIDVLVSPTRYANESEPIVNHEAMSHGVPVIAYGRGCIPEIVGEDGGRVIDPAEPFVPAALAQIEAWLSDPAALESASRAAARRYWSAHVENEQRWLELQSELLSAGGPKPPQALVSAEESASSN